MPRSSDTKKRVVGRHLTTTPPSERRRFWRRFAILAAAAAVFLAVVGIWTENATEEAIDDFVAENLKAIIRADVAALKLWLNREESEVRVWTKAPSVLEHVRNLVAQSSQSALPPESMLESPDHKSLLDIFSPSPSTEDAKEFFVIDRAGRILSASEETAVGLHLSPQGISYLARVFEKGTYVFKPYRVGSFISEIPTDPDRVQMAVASVIRDEAQSPIAVLGFLIEVDREFTQILSVGRMGETGDTYAFNKEGTMLSRTRFESQLKDLDLIPPRPKAGSILNVQIRDPGGDMTRGYEPKEEMAARPFTRAVASAISGKDGIDLHGYRDYRGVKVLGTWKWLPEYSMGIVTEISVDEVRHLTRPARRAFAILLAIIVMAIIAVLFFSQFLFRARRKLGELRKLGRYTLEEKIGEGGMGTVYRASHAMLRRSAAIKLLRPDIATDSMIARFEREVQLTSKLKHPNTIEIFDFGRTPEGVFYYVMEYLSGVDLAQLVAIDGPVSPARAVHILRQVCASLREAHEAGLIHRDIKPNNIILDQRGGESDVVKVLDFGLVKDVVTPDAEELTATEIIAGTPIYIAPEQITRERPVDARCDLYAVGALGFFLLTGKEIFQAGNIVDLAHHTLHTVPPRPSEKTSTAIPPELDQIIVDCLAKDPDQRPASAQEMMDVFDKIRRTCIWTDSDAKAWWEANARFMNAQNESPA